MNRDHHGLASRSEGEVMAAVRMADLPTTGTDVLVVGAGPTGLMAGLVLTRRGVPVVVADQKEGPTRVSRALAVRARRPGPRPGAMVHRRRRGPVGRPPRAGYSV